MIESILTCHFSTSFYSHVNFQTFCMNVCFLITEALTEEV